MACSTCHGVGKMWNIPQEESVVSSCYCIFFLIVWGRNVIAFDLSGCPSWLIFSAILSKLCLFKLIISVKKIIVIKQTASCLLTWLTQSQGQSWTVIINVMSTWPPPCRQPPKVMLVSGVHNGLMDELRRTWMKSSIMDCVNEQMTPPPHPNVPLC